MELRVENLEKQIGQNNIKTSKSASKGKQETEPSNLDTVKPSTPSNLENKIDDLYPDSSDDFKKIVLHLTNTKYKWRNAKTLASKTGLSEDKIAGIARNSDGAIIKSKAKSKRVIYRLDDEVKQDIEE